VQQAFAQLLLRFILRYPTRLSLLSRAERTLLARFLAGGLGQAYSQAALSAERRNLGTAAWLQVDRNFEGEQASVDRERKEQWHRVADRQLTLLGEEVSKSHPDESWRAEGWVLELNRCVDSLGFRHAVLALDMSGRQRRQPQQQVGINLATWHAAGLQTLLFIPDERISQAQPQDSLVRFERLIWQRRELIDMIEWRYSRFMTPKPSIENLSIQTLFKRNAFEQMVNRSVVEGDSLNPREWVANWNRAAGMVKGRGLLGSRRPSE
jgi:hypothetical protein